MARSAASLNKHKEKKKKNLRLSFEYLYLFCASDGRIRLVLSAFLLQSKINRENGNGCLFSLFFSLSLFFFFFCSSYSPSALSN